MKKIFLLCALLAAALADFAQDIPQDIPHKLTPADKVYGLSKFWEEVNYNFVYLDKVDRPAWDSTYKAMITQVEKTANDYAYYLLLKRFCALLKDGHTNINPSGEIGPLLFGKMFGNYWFSLDEVGGKAIVTRTLRANIAELPIGTEVIAVNGVLTRQYAKDSVEPSIASSTDYYRERASIQGLLAGLLGQPYDVQFKRPDGKVFSLHLAHARTTDTTFYPAFTQDSLLVLKWYPGGIAYLALNGFDNPVIDMQFVAKLPELYKAKALIVDLRNNGGGSTGIGTFILHYLTNDTILQHSHYYTRQHRPAFKAWGQYIKPKDTVGNAGLTEQWLSFHDQYYYDFGYSPDTIHLKAKRLVVPTAILVNNNTASAAEDFLIVAANQRHMTRIGEASYGSTGQPYLFELGGGFSARVCAKKDTYPDGSPFVGVGIQPDIAVYPSVQDVIEQRDPVLTKALAYLKGKL